MQYPSFIIVQIQNLFRAHVSSLKTDPIGVVQFFVDFHLGIHSIFTSIGLYLGSTHQNKFHKVCNSSWAESQLPIVEPNPIGSPL